MNKTDNIYASSMNKIISQFAPSNFNLTNLKIGISNLFYYNNNSILQSQFNQFAFISTLMYQGDDMEIVTPYARNASQDGGSVHCRKFIHTNNAFKELIKNTPLVPQPYYKCRNDYRFSLFYALGYAYGSMQCFSLMIFLIILPLWYYIVIELNDDQNKKEEEEEVEEGKMMIENEEKRKREQILCQQSLQFNHDRDLDDQGNLIIREDYNDDDELINLQIELKGDNCFDSVSSLDGDDFET